MIVIIVISSPLIVILMTVIIIIRSWSIHTNEYGKSSSSKSVI
uniref:Uncharacterized protein n=1 Tax=Moniliophthora roreri TaxID=221103 RepID=A0A0W0G304_MONRR